MRMIKSRITLTRSDTELRVLPKFDWKFG
jgi:hypothetical protein